MKLFQVKFILFAFLIAVIVSIIMSIGIHLLVKSELSYYLSDKVQESQIVSSLKSEINKFMLIWIPLLVFISIIIGFLILRRPVNSLNYIFKNLGFIVQGDLTRGVPAPKSNDFSELINLVNSVKSELINKTLEGKKITNQAINVIDKILKEIEVSNPDKGKISKLASELLAELEKLLVLANRIRC